MASTKEATVIIFDIGKHTTVPNETAAGEQTFFDLSKSCIEKILQRKILSQSVDEVALILMGTNNTVNALHTELEGYDNISELFDMGITNWEMLKILLEEVKPESAEADWLDAIIVALGIFNNHCEKKFKTFKLILINPFKSDINEDNFDAITEKLIEMNIELVVISNNVVYVPCTKESEEGEDEAAFDQSKDKTIKQQKSEQMIRELIHATNGVLCNFEDALRQMVHFDKKKTRATPWNCNLEIGSLFHIKISSYVQIEDTSASSYKWKTNCRYGHCKTIKEFILNSKPVDLETKPSDFLVKGHMYGSEPVAFDKSLGVQIDYGGKCLMCLGFTNSSLIKKHYIKGSTIRQVIAQTGFNVSEKKFVALVAVMRKLDVVLIARYMYSRAALPRIVALIPTNSKNPYKHNASLRMIELIFGDNLVDVHMPSLRIEKLKCTQEQYDAMDSFIDSMDLMNADPTGQNREAFPHKSIINPTFQYMNRAIVNRALYPTKPLQAPDPDLIELIEVPKKLKEDSVQSLEAIKKLFDLKPIIKKTPQDLINNITEASSSQIQATKDIEFKEEVLVKPLVEVGTVTPAQDFADLLSRGEKFPIISQQMQNVIIDLVFQSIVLPTNIVTEAIFQYRMEAKQQGPFRYNEWIGEFKNMLLEKKKVPFWHQVIVKEKFGLITSDETTLSTVSQSEADDFYVIMENTIQAPVLSLEADDDIDFLLDNM